jgi:hypothetical protein
VPYLCLCEARGEADDGAEAYGLGAVHGEGRLQRRGREPARERRRKLKHLRGGGEAARAGVLARILFCGPWHEQTILNAGYWSAE